MDQFNSKYYPIYASFLDKLSKDLTRLDFKKLINDTKEQINEIQI